MNVDTSNGKSKVISKYFTGKTDMDESLTDFQEKKSFKVLNNNKAPAVKPNVKKVKRVKGQKDIRTALKAKKNELVAYSEDFDSVCKKSGIDVDSEQLQLAIALSKSLQTTEATDSSASCSKSLTAQQRTGLIRTTLKEYGFKVPEKPNVTRKSRKRRKPYKLLLSSDEEKLQIITDRYTQRLFELNNLKKTTEDQDLVKSNLIYNMSTNIEYVDIKDDSVFYVESLIEETPNSMGCLLKKWSDIPGRPLSPQPNKSELILSEIEYSQGELDIVLSGRLKYSKDVLKKINLFKDRGKSIVEKDIDNKDSKQETYTIIIDKYKDVHLSPEVFKVCSDSDDSMDNCNLPTTTPTTVLEIKEKNLLVVTQPSRSLSPDLFDEDEDAIVELPVVTMTENILRPTVNVIKEASEIMDLTECVNTVSNKNSNVTKNIESVSQLSQPVDVTKRKSNDFMEMTECIMGTSQPIWGNNDVQIDLTGHCEEVITAGKTTGVNSNCADNLEIVDIGGISSKVTNIIDLTAYCENNVETNNATDNNNVVTTDKNIHLTENCVNINSACADSIEHMDLTQSSNSSTDTLPFVHISGKPIASDKSMEDTIIMNEDDYFETESTEVNRDINDSVIEKLNVETEIKTHDTIPAISPKHILLETPIISLDESEVAAVDDGIDLTQSSDSNEASNIVTNYSSHQINNSSLGKRDNVSVDYDEALENMNSFPYYTHDQNDDDSTQFAEKHSPNNNQTDQPIISNSRQPALDLAENNLKCPSIADNGENNFDFGGISLIDNLPSFNRKSRNTMTNGSMSDSLPRVNVKGRVSSGKTKSPIEDFLDPLMNSVNNRNLINNEPNEIPQTPQNKVNSNINVETPDQSEYIVKTDNVTPMLHYASMTTPERNRELDKYGLKPFKRKRAIQLLTHLYNQTHPYVESTEELTSPSKKHKRDDTYKPSSSKSSSTTSPRNQSKSPRKTLKSPRKQYRSPRKCAGDSENFNELDQENYLFRVTNEVPVIRNIECDADDWVFQKREKAKLHSCRVPLHVAFHNFLTCRRGLHEAVLRYEPVNIDVTHKELAASGHRYDRKDLLKFMDKKCITVKTADVKNSKRY